jgi:hypothetical protein
MFNPYAPPFMHPAAGWTNPWMQQWMMQQLMANMFAQQMFAQPNPWAVAPPQAPNWNWQAFWQQQPWGQQNPWQQFAQRGQGWGSPEQASYNTPAHTMGLFGTTMFNPQGQAAANQQWNPTPVSQPQQGPAAATNAYPTFGGSFGTTPNFSFTPSNPLDDHMPPKRTTARNGT